VFGHILTSGLSDSLIFLYPVIAQYTGILYTQLCLSPAAENTSAPISYLCALCIAIDLN